MTEAVAAWRRKAVDLLARREYSRAELARKLAGREADIDHAALDTVLREYRHHGVGLILCGAGSRVRLQLRRAGIHRREQQLAYVHDLEQARGKALRWLGEKTEPALAGAV